MPVRTARTILLTLAIALTIVALIAASANPILDLSRVFPVFQATFVALVTSLILSFLPKVRRQSSLIPRWFEARVMVSVATLPALLLLGMLALAALAAQWLEAWQLMLRAIIILLIAYALMAIWSLLGLNLQRLLSKAIPPEPPPAAH